MTEPCALFVYGTLKRGEERAGRWPRAPLSIDRATIRGMLYDLGPYPALAEGDSRILGELWRFAAEDIDETLRVLDQIECYGNEAVDLYSRRVVTATTLAGVREPAYTYYFGNADELEDHAIVLAGPNGMCEWTGAARRG